MNTTYLLTGGNLGDRLAYLNKASAMIDRYCGDIVQTSSVYETAAWGFTDQPSFYNMVIELKTELSADELMKTLLQIEETIGRIRTQKMGPRTIDIDILLFNNDVIQTPLITIPHPRLTERRFVLTPLAEIAANVIHPVAKKTMQQLLDECKDTLDVHKI